MDEILGILGKINLFVGTIGNFILSHFLSREVAYSSGYRIEYETNFKMYCVWFVVIELIIITESAILCWMETISAELKACKYYLAECSDNTEKLTKKFLDSETVTSKSYSNPTAAKHISHSKWECPCCGEINESTAQFCKRCGKYK